MNRTIIRSAAAGVIATGVLTITSIAASAHVGTATEAIGGGVTKVTFSFTHGCEELPTDSLRIQLPDNVSAVMPEDPPGWTSTLSGNELTWTGGPAVDGVKTDFVATMTVAGTAGETVFFPTLQGCPGGAENAWIDKSDDPEATAAAPRIQLVETVAAPETTTSTSISTTAPTTVAAAPGTEVQAAEAATTPPPKEINYTETRSNTALIIYSTLIALVVIGIGGFALSRRSSSKS